MRVDPEGEFWWVAAGAAVGAIVNVGVTFTIDVMDGSIDESAATYLSSAASGAVQGAVIAGTGGLGGAIAGGALGSITEDLVYAGISGESVSFGEVAKGAAMGGALGAVGHGGGKLVGKGTSKLYSKTFSSDKAFVRFVNKMTIPTKVSRRRAVGSLEALLQRSAKKEASDALTRFVLQVGGKVLANAGSKLVSGLMTSPSVKGGTGGGTFSIISRANAEINAARPRAYGEYVHYNLFLDAVSLADRPVPSHPNNTLTGF